MVNVIEQTNRTDLMKAVLTARKILLRTNKDYEMHGSELEILFDQSLQKELGYGFTRLVWSHLQPAFPGANEEQFLDFIFLHNDSFCATEECFENINLFLVMGQKRRNEGFHV
jgi:hypothetical protein